VGRDNGVPFDGPGWGGPDGLVGGCGAAGAEDEFDGVDGEEEGCDPRDYCEKGGFAAGTVGRASKRGGGCGESNSGHCLEADDEQEGGDFYNDRVAFVGNLTPHADGLEGASSQKESEGYEVCSDEELEDRGLEIGHESLSFRVVDDEDEEPDGNERHHDAEFNSAFLEETKRCRGNGLHGELIL